MVRGVPYADVASTLGEVGRGFTHDMWMEYLARHGFAVQFHYQHDCIARQTRQPWPLAPWADLHICSVDAGQGMGSHAVVMLADGTVLDPATDTPRRLTDYASVAYMAAIHRVPADRGETQAVTNEDIEWLAREAIRTGDRTLARIATALKVGRA
jgi:hypothetical protein